MDKIYEKNVTVANLDSGVVTFLLSCMLFGSLQQMFIEMSSSYTFFTGFLSIHQNYKRNSTAQT